MQFRQYEPPALAGKFIVDLITYRMRRWHRVVFFLIAVLALATFIFGVLMLVGAKK